MVWAVVDYQFIRQMLNTPTFNMSMIAFFLIHLSPFWFGILNFIRLFFVFSNTIYVLTNRRLIQRSGFWGIDFQSLDHDQIADIQITVNPLDNILGTGTILVTHAGVTPGTKPDKIIGVKDPYSVFSQIKTVSVDVKTDWNYPNSLRPGDNPGYKTSYEPKAK